jgi:hypothetical protein
MYSGFNRQRELRGYSFDSKKEDDDLVIGIGTVVGPAAKGFGQCGAVLMERSGKVTYTMDDVMITG